DGRVRSESSRRAGKDRALASPEIGARRGNQAGGRGRNESPFRLGLSKRSRSSLERLLISTAPNARRLSTASVQPASALALYSSKQKQDDDDHQHEAQPSRGVIAPAGAIGPGGEGTDEKQNQDDDQNSPERHE